MDFCSEFLGKISFYNNCTVIKKNLMGIIPCFAFRTNFNVVFRDNFIFFS